MSINPVRSETVESLILNSRGLPAIASAAYSATPQLTFYIFSRKQLLLTTPL